MTDHDPIPAAAIADAVVKLGLPVRVAPAAIRRATPGPPIRGRALPARHSGSVDVFLEALDDAQPGDILVIDDEGRTSEACIGDLAIGEAKLAGIAGVVVWGLHRDGVELRGLGVPVWSLGTSPLGPTGLRPPREDRLARADLGGITVTREDTVVADDDGVLVVATADLPAVLETARTILATERAQADLLAGGRRLRDQLDWTTYRTRRAADPTYDLRRHLRERGGAIET